MKQQELIERWRGHPGVSLRELLLAKECASPFGLADQGQCDFRGVDIHESLHGVRVTQADFSYSTMAGGQLHGDFQDCSFRQCRYEGNIARQFARCDFSESDLSGSWIRGQMSECILRNVRMVSVRSNDASFEQCLFSKVNLRKAAFYDCKFVACQFEDCEMISGALTGSKFIDCRFARIKIKRTVLKRVSGLEGVEGVEGVEADESMSNRSRNPKGNAP